MKFKFLLIFFSFSFTFFLSQKFENYTVKDGDSYFLIGKKFQINYLDIIKLNRGKRLLAGEVIQIPFYFFHTVKDSENLSLLAKKYSVSTDDIIRINDLKNKFLFVGQKIKIPKFFSTINVSSYLENDEGFNPNRSNDYLSDIRESGNNLSFTWPVNGRVMERNLPQSIFSDNMSLGIPIKTLNNDTVQASEDGIVVFQGEVRGFGKVLLINHRGGITTAYMGLKDFTLYENQVVQKGQAIAKSQRSIFFSIFLRGDPQNPADFLKTSSS